MNRGIPVKPDEMLADLFDALQHERPCAVTTREWLIAGLLRALRRDEPLEHALRLASPDGGRGGTVSRRLKMLKRNAFLARALQVVALDDSAGLWPRCVRLAEEVERFQRTEWALYRYTAAPPAHWPEARAMVWYALRCDVGLPGTAQGLYSVFKSRVGCFQESEWERLLANYL